MLIRKHGNITMSSPQMYSSGGIHPYHHEILYISSGEVELSWQNYVYKASGPVLFLLTPNTPHQLIKLSTQYSFLFMEVDIEHDPFPNLNEIIHWNAMQGQLSVPSYGLTSVFQTMNLIRNHFESELSENSGLLNQLVSTEMFKVTMLVRHLVAYSLYTPQAGKQNSDSSSTHSVDEALELLMHFMESYYREDITLQDLADQIHLNSSYLIRIFKQKTGMTPIQYLNHLRMNAAINHLSNHNLSIQDIVKLTGYQNIHYFSRAFKKTFGVSPSQWRLLQEPKD
ncbi:hypothetical protein PAT3040_04893 [Paenibacillus agaridevorans]|uniref:HTH araC/xylS-type domain-containing protein n=1 Tax=Paenibacillus agaridevorans TaxID=171404 RepID=A0A2R5EVM6_9BACL|nr:AraC family transcriptional regulator [Paenibacillus agaridevorans]GBG10175.1 hypothetical protein PAT3040_04893 [Paenibacillus agaridevorans]